MNSRLVSYLFETRAIRVCPKDRPFWYTSGKIGPYYINTHFLYGSEDEANRLLELIDAVKEDRKACTGEIEKAVLEQYRRNEIYRGTIDTLMDYASGHLAPDGIDFISGGERRDWFFSVPVASLLGKPHVTLFKDMDSVVYENGKSLETDDLKGASVLHVADLITTASSYTRAWIPIVSGLGARMEKSLAVVDRLQGGAEALAARDVESHALVRIDRSVFEEACRRKYIDEDQLKMVLDYMEDPDGSMRLFLLEHPGFVSDALKSGGKAAERARLLVENDFYNLRDSGHIFESSGAEQDK